MTAGNQTGIDSVIELLTRLAIGDLEARGDRTGAEDDDLDAVMAGINMLAEELGANRDELEQRVADRTVELEAARAEAQESTRLKSEFLATMSHEIRTPMNGVIGLTDLLLRTPLDETQHQYAQGVQRAGEALLLVINDILDFSKLEAGMVDLEIAGFDPRELVDGVAALVALTAAQKELELIAYCMPTVPTELFGDEGRLRQILLNLASNAVKFTDQGEVVISARAVVGADGGHLLRFQVADTGIGIKPEDQSLLFQSFTQADASTTRRFGGTGLGLAISRRLTEAMDGRMGLDSEEGIGSTFWFEVPLPVAAAGRVAPSPPRLDVLTGARVLVVDDNATNRMVLQAQLTAWGMRPDVLDRPEVAVPLMMDAVAAKDPYVVAVLDMCMPVMDGIELARLISAEPTLGSTRMIMLSSGIEADRSELQRAGVQEWLSKPVRSSEFFDRLMRLMTPEPVAAAAAAPPAPEPVATTSKGRVLVVEDNVLNQMVAQGMVVLLGYEVDIANNGAEALEAVATTRYAAVLMDCHMPVMDGFTATAEIRRREVEGQRLPIVAMTAAATSEDRDRCIAAGMDDYVSKPVDASVLDNVLDCWARQEATLSADADEPRPDDSVLDPAQLSVLRRLGPDDGWGLLPAVAHAFLEMWPALVAELRQALTSGDSPAVTQVAHQIKGAAANVGAVLVAEVSGRIELAAATGSAHLGLVDQLQDELASATRLLRLAVP